MKAEDVVQDTVVSVTRKLKEFHYDPAAGSFKSWLLVITRRRIVDYRRKHFRRRRDDGTSQSADNDDSERLEAQFEQIWREEWEQHLLATAVEAVKRQVKPKQFQLFNYYVLKKWPVSKVSDTFFGFPRMETSY